MSTPLGNDDEIRYPDPGQQSDPNAGWGEDGAVTELPPQED